MSVRSWGPFAALSLPALCALGGVALLGFVECEEGCIGLAAISLFLVLMAAPTLALFGLFLSEPALVFVAVLTSVPLWLLLGRWIAARAENAEQPWRRWWGIYGRSVGLVLVAVLIAALLIALIGRF